MKRKIFPVSGAVLAASSTAKLWHRFLFLCGISPHFVRSGDIPLFIYLYAPSVCHVVSIRKRENHGNECLCIAAISLFGPGVVIWRIISTCFLGAINLQGKEKFSCFLFYFIKRVVPAILQGVIVLSYICV